MIKHYVEYLHPGIVTSDTSTIKIKSRNPKKIKLDDNHSFGFRFYDREEKSFGKETLKGKRKNFSNWYYEGTIYTLGSVKKHHPDEKILISNIEINNIEKVVKTKFGQSIPLKKGDIIL